METRIIKLVVEEKKNSFEIKSKVFVADPNQKNPSIFITPIFGGMPLLENIIGRMFSYAGYNAFITDFMPYANFKSQVKDLDVHDRTYRKSVIGLEELRKHATTLPYVDPKRMGLFGMSLGGIFTSLNAKVNKNFKASVIIAGSGDHSKVLSESKQGLIKELKERRKKYFKLKSDKEYEMLMNKHNEMDSLKIYKVPPKDSVLMVIAKEDEHVPTEAQVETWKEFRKPEAIFVDKSHFPTIILTPFTHFKKILRFYDKKFFPGRRPRGKNVI